LEGQSARESDGPHAPAGQPPRESTGRDIPLDRLSQRLANELPAAILKFATGAGHAPLSGEQQADLFRDQAERFADRGLWLSAAQLYEAASLVAPEDLETHLRWEESVGRPAICVTREAFGQDRSHRVAPLLVDVAANKQGQAM
jgi:hypothetical protein